MKSEEELVLMNCLFFSANRFARHITKLTEDVFEQELAPSYLYMVMVIHFHPGITQKELCQRLSIAPSTSTRFIDKLVKHKMVDRKMDGKETNIYLTQIGEEKYVEFRRLLKELFEEYATILGKDFSLQLSRMLHEASEKFED
ncbi:MarR family winged helix-turn-helix transcriptional regulator [Mangrovibacillus cuniculi]|uniref:MarR family transcriptional regulator n=1 Tax=Mangrovibacillus cuniculi TaxID=2593652 RepID=A0A7S8C971_9BACI|nr:MarR family transcriptional regulator [Mangrovibacillus cuniculi]QPC45672.1 MarR family transcriptional regulator [Mangrovibacillus cuniculi]